jgi:hypothetical protein
MRCVRCDFENIPGQTRCIRCGSILEAAGVVIQIHPPRMPAWRKPFRDMMRHMRGWHLAPQKSLLARVSPRLDAAVSTGLAGVVLSVIPGFAHLLAGRLRELRLLLPLWLVLLGVGLFLYGSPPGFLLIGLAIGVHAWIAVQYGLFKEIDDLLSRVGAVVLLVVVFAVLYWATPHVVVPRLRTGYTALTIPARDVHSGDLFLTWRQRDTNEPLVRGTLVLVRPRGLHLIRGRRSASLMAPMIGQVVGLPGEMLEIRDKAFMVDEQRLDPNHFPVPHWLLHYDSRVPIPLRGDSYFVSSEYAREGRGGLTDQAIGSVCIVKADEVRGRAFMQWWPLSRRRHVE